MPLPIPDALLLVLLAGSMALLIGGDLSSFVKDQWRLRTSLGDAATAPGRDSATTTLRRADVPGLPNITTPRAPARTPVAPGLPPAADLLLVDDSAVARAKLRRLFEGAGYRVHLANDGVEALARLNAGRYAMMITDLEMPNMDGVALVNACVRQPQTARMPILAVSAHENLRAKFNECRDIAGVHRKPWVDDILLSHVAALVGTPAAVAR